MHKHRDDEYCQLNVDIPLQHIVDDLGTPILLRNVITDFLTWQARNMISIRMILHKPQITPACIAALIALEAKAIVQNNPAGVCISDLLVKSNQSINSLGSLKILKDTPDSRWGEAHVSRTPADQPLIFVVAAIGIANGIVRYANIALSGVWPESARLAHCSLMLLNGPLDDERINVVAESVRNEVNPVGDFWGSKEYRQKMSQVLTCRTLRKCLSQDTHNG